MPLNKNAYLWYLAIDRLLAKRKFSREQLLQRINSELNINITKFTIDKDLKFLKEHFNAPIKPSKDGLYYADPEFTIAAANLSKAEQRALEFAIDVLENVSNSVLIQEAQATINKLYRKLNAGKRDSKVISSDVNLKVEGVEHLSRLYDAICQKECIIIDYNSPRQKKVVKHQFSPYALKEYQGMWYVIGYSDQKEFTIVLALDRIKSIRASSVSFHPDPDFSPTKYFKYSFGITHRQYNKPEKVKFWVDKDAYYYMKVRPLHSTQKVLEEKEDGYIVQLEVFLSEELLIELMGLGGRVKVLSPPELVSDIKRYLIEMNQHYNLK